MLEKIDLSKTADKETYQAVKEQMGARLGLLQRECRAAGIPVILVFEGMGAAGKGIQINRLIENLDPRGFSVYAPSGETEDVYKRQALFWQFLWQKKRCRKGERKDGPAWIPRFV